MSDLRTFRAFAERAWNTAPVRSSLQNIHIDFIVPAFKEDLLNWEDNGFIHLLGVNHRMYLHNLLLIRCYYLLKTFLRLLVWAAMEY